MDVMAFGSRWMAMMELVMKDGKWMIKEQQSHRYYFGIQLLNTLPKEEPSSTSTTLVIVSENGRRRKQVRHLPRHARTWPRPRRHFAPDPRAQGQPLQPKHERGEQEAQRTSHRISWRRGQSVWQEGSAA